MPEWKKKNLDDASKKIEEVVYMESCNTQMKINKHAHVDCICLLWGGLCLLGIRDYAE